MKIRKILAILILFVSFLNIHASTDTPESLSLPDFVTLASSNDIRFQRILYSRLYLDYNRELNLPVDQMLLSIQGQYDVRFGSQDGISSSVRLSRIFAQTGTTLNAEYSTYSNSVSSNSTALEVYVSQPVLKNAFGRLNSIKERLVDIDSRIIELTIAETYEEYLASLIMAYYEWYEIYENLIIARASYEENRKLLDNMQKRRRANIALPIDVNKVKIQLLGKKQSLMELDAAYEEAYRIVRETIGETSSISLIPQLPQGVISEIDEPASRTQELYGLLMEKSRGNEEILSEELIPDLRVNLGVAISGDKIWIEDNQNSIFSSVSFDLPFFNTKAKARIEVAQLETMETELEGEDILLKLKRDTGNLESAMEWKEKMISIIDERIALAASIMKGESENYTLGKADLNDYISAVNSYDSQRYSRLSQQMALLKLKLEHARITDTLLTKLPAR